MYIIKVIGSNKMEPITLLISYPDSNQITQPNYSTELLQFTPEIFSIYRTFNRHNIKQTKLRRMKNEKI